MKQFAAWLASLEFWVVALLVATSMVTPILLPTAVLVAAFFWIIRWVAYGRPSVRTPADWAVLLLALMSLVTLWATALPGKTYTQAFRLMAGILFYYAIANWSSSRRRIYWIVVGLVFAGVFLALFALVSVEWATTKLPFIPTELYQPFSVLVQDTANPNVMAGTIVLLIPVVLALVLFSWKSLIWWLRALVVLSLTSMGGVLLLTQSRGAWMALGVASVGLIILRWRWGWLSLAAILAGILAAFYYFGSTLILETLVSSATIGGVEGRIEVWSRAIYMAQDFPFTGIGMGTYGEVADLMYPFYLKGEGIIHHAHNLFLQIAVDLGMPGLIAWLASLGVICYITWKVYASREWMERHSRLMVALGAGLLCSQLALVVHGLTDAVTWGMIRPAPLVWALWGLAVAAWLWTQRVYKESNREYSP